MKCDRKKPESCFNCTLPECIDDGNGSPQKEESRILAELLPDHKKHRKDKRWDEGLL